MSRTLVAAQPAARGAWARQVRHLALATALLLAAGACSDGEEAGSTPLVVASTTILGDVVASVVADDARVEVLMPVGTDPHDFEPSARQVALLDGADLVVWVGDLEPGLTGAVEQAAAGGTKVLALLPLVDPLPASNGEAPDEGADRGHGDLDPHFWFDPLRMATAAAAIGNSLNEVDPSMDWNSRAKAYAVELVGADADISEILAAVPPDRRRLVTNHDTLSYFADRYGFEVVGTVIPSVTSLAEPSSAEMARLVETIRAEGVPAIFADTTNPTILADALAAELGQGITVVPLFTDSLGGPGSGAETYLDLIRANAMAIAAALR